jgi:hypothetical protein
MFELEFPTGTTCVIAQHKFEGTLLQHNWGMQIDGNRGRGNSYDEKAGHAIAPEPVKTAF